MAFAILAVTSLSAFAASPAYSAFTTTTSNSSTFGTVATFPTYPSSVGADSPWAFHRQEESPSAAATLAAADSSGNGHPGAYNGYTNGPATHWKLDENAGSTATDSSGAANTGTAANSPAWTTGKVGSALSLNGTTEYVEGTRPAVDTSTSFSVAAWVYLTAKGTNRTAVAQDGTVISGYFLQYEQSYDKWAFTRRPTDTATPGTAVLAKSTAAVTLNTWYHLVGVYDSGAGTIKLYVNGSLQETTAFASPWSATGALSVGRAKWDGDNTDFFPGRIDEVRLYQRALTAAEALSLGNGLPVTDWEFSEGVGNTTTDRGTGEQDGTLTAPTWTTAGHDGNAVSFNGSSSVAIGSPVVDTSTSYTVSAWVNLTSKTTGPNLTALCQHGTVACAYWLQYDKDFDRWAFAVSTADSAAASSPQAVGTSSPTTNTWYHVTGVHDSVADTIKLYVNGVLQDTVAFASGWNATVALRAGSGYWVTPNEFLPGRIDTVKTFQRVLSATEIANLYNGVGYTEADLTAGLTGALQGDLQGQQATTAVAFAGLANAYNDTSRTNPSTFTIECWFRSASATGGVIMDFGDQRTGPSTDFDRMIYLDSANRISFGVNPAGTKSVLRSTATYNDGAWHHVAASLGAAGQKLYLDGDLVAADAAVTTAQNFTGWWRWGGEATVGWPNPPTTGFLTGTIDEVAVYATQLDDQRIANHYAADH